MTAVRITPVPVPAQDVRVGDDIVYLGVPHRVLEITEHQAPAAWGDLGITEYCIARGAEGWGYALLPGQPVEVLR